jgi:antitoxin component of MazEF toxin-antitoxin module
MKKIKFGAGRQLRIPADLAQGIGVVAGDWLLAYVHDQEIRLLRVDPARLTELRQVAGCMARRRRRPRETTASPNRA